MRIDTPALALGVAAAGIGIGAVGGGHALRHDMFEMSDLDKGQRLAAGPVLGVLPLMVGVVAAMGASGVQLPPLKFALTTLGTFGVSVGAGMVLAPGVWELAEGGQA